MAVGTVALPSATHWLFDNPSNAFRWETLRQRPFLTQLILFSAALCAAALGDALAQGPNLTYFGMQAGSWLVLMVSYTVLFCQISRWASGSETPFREWFTASLYVFAPVHLLLPAGLIVYGLGSKALVLYWIVKAMVGVSLVQRALAGISALNRWPRWAAFLLILTPFVLSVLVLLVGGIVAVIALLVVAGAS